MNADTAILKAVGASNIKTVDFSTRTDKSSEATKQIEFENKETGSSKKPDDFTSIFDMTDDDEKEQEAESFSKEQAEIERNVYLKERPEMDIFRAIFEDDEDDEPEPEPAPNEEEDEKEEDQADIEMISEVSSKEVIANQAQEKSKSTIAIIPSSFDRINVREVKKFVDISGKDEDEDYYDQLRKKKDEPKKEAKKASEIVVVAAAASSSDSDGDSSSDSSVEIVYEEISLEDSKSSSSKHKKKKKGDSSSGKKKKKKHSHKKKSKKSSHKK